MGCNQCFEYLKFTIADTLACFFLMSGVVICFLDLEWLYGFLVGFFICIFLVVSERL